jgi:pyrroloquinoline quinone biosynthesis protein D
VTAAAPVSVAAGDAALLARVPRLGAGFRLQWEPVQGCHVLLYPEGMVKLNRPAGEILSRCDGERELATVVAELERAFGATGLAGDVLAFVRIAEQQRWLAWRA